MNRDIMELREVVQKLVPLLAGKGLVVTQRGSQAYVRTNTTTKQPEEVNIPNIPDNASQEFIWAIQGFIDHEVGHILHTDWHWYGGKGGVSEADLRNPAKRAFMNTHNIVEDVMIEREMAKTFPGARRNISNTRKWFLAKITDEALKGVKDPREQFNYLIVPAMRALGDHEEMQEWMDKGGWWKNKYVAELIKMMKPGTLDLLKTCTTTKETLVIAEEVHAIIMGKVAPPAPPAPPKPPEKKKEDKKDKGKSKDKPEKEAGEGEGDGERDHKEPEKKEDEKPSDDGKGKKEDEDDKGEGSGDEEEAEEEADEPDAGDDDGDEDAEPVGDDEDGPAADEADGEDADDDDDEPAAGASGDDGEDESEASGSAAADEDDGEDDEPAGAGSGGVGEPDEDEGGEGSEGFDDDAPGGPQIITAGADGGGVGDPDDETEEETQGGGGGVGNGMSKSLFDFEDGDFDEVDMSAQIAIKISEEAVLAMDPKQYLVYTRDLDRIEPVVPPADMKKTWVPSLEEDTRQMTSKMRKDIERMMASQSHVIRTPGHRNGKLHAPSLFRVPQGDPRVFTQKQEHVSKDTAVELVIDNSGSMSGAKMKLAMTAGYALCTTLDAVKIAHEVIGFTTGGWHHLPHTIRQAITDDLHKSSIHWDRVGPLVLPIYKTFEERVTATVKARFAYMREAQVGISGNVDGESLEYCAERLLKRPEKRKVMMVLSDGQPAGSHKAGPHLSYVVKQLGKMGIECIGIGIQDDSVKRYYPKFTVLHNAADLPGQVMGEIKMILMS